MFLMDLSATCDGYHADITRPTVVGRPSEKQKRVHEVVLEAQLKANDRRRRCNAAFVLGGLGNKRGLPVMLVTCLAASLLYMLVYPLYVH